MGSCHDVTFADVALPYGHASAENLELIEREGTLTIRATKTKPVLDLKIVRASPPPDEQPLASTRDEQEEERQLESKFKIAIDSVAKQTNAVEKMKVADAGVGEQQQQTITELDGKATSPSGEKAETPISGEDPQRLEALADETPPEQSAL